MQSFENSSFLEDQASSWRARAGTEQIHSLCAFETRTTKGVIVVNRASAQSLCTGKTLPSDEDHSGIAKPRSKDSLVYKFLADTLLNLSIIE